MLKAPFGMPQTCDTCVGNYLDDIDNRNIRYCSLKVNILYRDNKLTPEAHVECRLENCTPCEYYKRNSNLIPSMIYLHSIEDLKSCMLSYIRGEYYSGTSCDNEVDAQVLFKWLDSSGYLDGHDVESDEDIQTIYNNILSKYCFEFPAIAYIKCEKGFNKVRYDTSILDIQPISKIANY